jgi:hypothetical protein
MIAAIARLRRAIHDGVQAGVEAGLQGFFAAVERLAAQTA